METELEFKSLKDRKKIFENNLPNNNNSTDDLENQPNFQQIKNKFETKPSPSRPSKPKLNKPPPPIPANKPDLNLLKSQLKSSQQPSIRKSIQPKDPLLNNQSQINPIKNELAKVPIIKTNSSPKLAPRSATLIERKTHLKSQSEENIKINDKPPELPTRQSITIHTEEPEELNHLFTDLKDPFASYQSSAPIDEPPKLPPRRETMPVQTTFSSSPLHSPTPRVIDIWYNKIPPKNKARYEKLFNELDTELEDFIWGTEARNIMIRSRLDCDTLAKIWDLVDINTDGQLDRNEFCVMLFLIDRRLEGYSIPSNL